MSTEAENCPIASESIRRASQTAAPGVHRCDDPGMPLSFRDLLAGDDLIVAPGAYDAITARAVERAGFPMVHMTGAGVAAARGYPDYGLVTMTEMVDSAATLARSVSVPVLADADTGYGNELNVTRTVREYESRGVAGIHLEDQVSPKRCGHLAGKQVVERAAVHLADPRCGRGPVLGRLRHRRPHRRRGDRRARRSDRPDAATRSPPGPTSRSSRRPARRTTSPRCPVASPARAC